MPVTLVVVPLVMGDEAEVGEDLLPAAAIAGPLGHLDGGLEQLPRPAQVAASGLVDADDLEHVGERRLIVHRFGNGPGTLGIDVGDRIEPGHGRGDPRDGAGARQLGRETGALGHGERHQHRVDALVQLVGEVVDLGERLAGPRGFEQGRAPLGQDLAVGPSSEQGLDEEPQEEAPQTPEEGPGVLGDRVAELREGPLQERAALARRAEREVS